MEDKHTTSPKVKLSIAFGLTLMAAALLQFAGQNWSKPLYDYFFCLRGSLPTDSEVVVVGIDEASFDEINEQWPWPRSLHAKLIDQVFAAGAKTMALDVLFAEPATDPTQDTALAEAINRNKNVILAQDISYEKNPELGFEQVKLIAPDSIVSQLTIPPILGFVSITPESDGYLRHVLLSFPDGPAFSLAAAENFLGVKNPPAAKDHPDDLKLINFAGPPQSIPTVSYYQALDPQTYLPPNFFKNKLVFLGMSVASEANIFTATADHFLVPFSRLDGAYMPGVKVHASAALSVLHDRFIKRPSMSHTIVGALVLCFLSSLVFLSYRPLFSTLLFLVIGTSYFVGAFYAFANYQWDLRPVYFLLPLTIAYVASPFIHYYDAFKQKAFIRKAFSMYLSPRLVAELIANPERLELGGEEAEGTVVFLDLAGFTSFSEKLKPRELIELINRNLGTLAELVLKWDGMIDKYIGDCIMAVWGVPIHTNDHALRACNAVVDIQREMAALAARENAITGVNLSVRVGVNSGILVAGNVGGGKQFNYTVLGNEVNLASRLESINKFYGTDIIISESTVVQLHGEFLFRELDLIRVVGQKKPTKIYQLWGKGAATPEQSALDAVFQDARRLYLEQQWEAAERRFEDALKLDPEDGPSKKYALRCKEFALTPPPADWDGVYQMLTK